MCVSECKEEEKNEVPPRFELGSLDSKSRVLTITPWDQREQSVAFAPIKLKRHIAAVTLALANRIQCYNQSILLQHAAESDVYRVSEIYSLKNL